VNSTDTRRFKSHAPALFTEPTGVMSDLFTYVSGDRFLSITLEPDIDLQMIPEKPPRLKKCLPARRK
jgi:hypothetical protein